MTYFFVFVLVILIAIIALVATGRMSRSQVDDHDQRPSYVPQAPVTADSLRQVRFGFAFRGYRMDEVDELIRQMADTLEPPVTPEPEPPQESLPEPVAPNTGGNEGIPEGHTE